MSLNSTKIGADPPLVVAAGPVAMMLCDHVGAELAACHHAVDLVCSRQSTTTMTASAGGASVLDSTNRMSYTTRRHPWRWRLGLARCFPDQGWMMASSCWRAPADEHELAHARAVQGTICRNERWAKYLGNGG